MSVICNICKKKFQIPIFAERHSKRKYPCKPVEEKVSLRISENLRESPRISENLSNLKVTKNIKKK